MSAHDEQQAELLENVATFQRPVLSNGAYVFLTEDDRAALLAGAAALRRASPETGTCEWRFHDAWRTTCGLTWGIDNDATPAENKMAYCPKCGKPLVVRPQEAE